MSEKLYRIKPLEWEKDWMGKYISNCMVARFEVFVATEHDLAYSLGKCYLEIDQETSLDTMEVDSIEAGKAIAEERWHYWLSHWLEEIKLIDVGAGLFKLAELKDMKP